MMGWSLAAAGLGARETAPPARWPSFRGPGASGLADGPQGLPPTFDGLTGTNLRWKVPVPGLAHASPIVWGDRIYLATAISSRGDATFKPGLYGDGTASQDKSTHRWVVMALDRGTGRTLWERVAFEGTPVDTRHIKSTYASATPATNGDVIVASFGSQGLVAYDTRGRLKWTRNLGRQNLGAYDIPSYEWGPASSPIIWRDRVIVQVDTAEADFVAALDLATGKTLWQTPRGNCPRGPARR
jgi:outer membrane protein assembly factor BamB